MRSLPINRFEKKIFQYIQTCLNHLRKHSLMAFISVVPSSVSYLEFFGSMIKSVIKMNRSKNCLHDLKIVKKKMPKVIHSIYHV